jgi:phosphomannomutase
MYGVSKTSLQTILLTLRCDVDVINDRHDTLFGGKLPSPSAATLGKLSAMVVEEGYDIGLGTDGDADRLGVIDDKGRFITPNEIMMLLYYYLVKYKGWKGDVVRNFATTHVLDDMAKDFGYTCHEVPVGFKYISSKIEETDAILGGESSGGLTVRGHISGKDGIFAASLLVEMMAVTKNRLSVTLNAIYERYGFRYMAENSYTFQKEDKERLRRILYTDRSLPDFKYEISKVSYADGLKVYFSNGGWIVARFSGTEPLLRVFAEMPTEKEANAVCKKMKDFLEV